MSYFKWAVISSVFAFIVSAGLGFISGVTFILIIARAFIFASLFFGLGFVLRFVVTNYFPDLFLPRDATESQYPADQKQTVESMKIDTTGEYAVPELYKSSGDQNELGNIEDLVSGAFRSPSESVDRMEEEGYNGRSIQSEMEVKFKASAAGNQEIINFQDMFDDAPVVDEPRVQKVQRQDFTPSLGNDDSGGLGGLPDLDSMAMAFGGMASFPESTGSSYGGDIEPAPLGRTEPEPSESRYVGNKPQPLKGDFNPQEIAKGISTVLLKDK